MNSNSLVLRTDGFLSFLAGPLISHFLLSVLFPSPLLSLIFQHSLVSNPILFLRFIHYFCTIPFLLALLLFHFLHFFTSTQLLFISCPLLSIHLHKMSSLSLLFAFHSTSTFNTNALSCFLFPAGRCCRSISPQVCTSWALSAGNWLYVCSSSSPLFTSASGKESRRLER